MVLLFDQEWWQGPEDSLLPRWSFEMLSCVYDDHAQKHNNNKDA